MFHVPEGARFTSVARLASDADDGNNGVFVIPSCEPGWDLFIIASDGGGWEHVSVHAARREGHWHGPARNQQRTPNWREMCLTKATFWDDEDAVMQLHPKKSDYVNQHPHTLHLWRPTWTAIPLPDPGLVGVK